ncbi:MAG: hypothetical protein ABSE85_02660 [Candidatus Korobacteraceae bacterium]|jgi:hypothetical protein
MTPEESRKESRQIRLAEYTAIRSEITTLLTVQLQFINFSVLLGGVLTGLFIAHPSFEAAVFFPLPFLILGLLYGDAKARILRAARYIHAKLRPTLIDPADEPTSLRWEIFIREESTLNPFLAWADWLRWVAFLVPLTVPIPWLIRNRPPTNHWVWVLMVILFGVEVLLFVLLIWVIALKLDGYSEGLLDEKEK